MGNSVTFVVRDDYLDSVTSLDWESLSQGIFDSSDKIRFIEEGANDGAESGNHVNGFATSHYEHITGETILYIDSNILCAPPLLYGLRAEELSLESIVGNSRKTSKYILGSQSPYTVTKSEVDAPIASVVSESSLGKPESIGPKTHVFRYFTDNTNDIRKDETVLKNLGAYVKTGDKSFLSRYIQHIATLESNESMLFCMHDSVSPRAEASAIMKFDAPLIDPDSVNRMRIGNFRNSNTNKIISSQAVMRGLGYDVEPMVKRELSSELSPP